MEPPVHVIGTDAELELVRLSAFDSVPSSVDNAAGRFILVDGVAHDPIREILCRLAEVLSVLRKKQIAKFKVPNPARSS